MPSMLTFSYPSILNLFPQYQASGRSESAAFLIWYLENYLRIDSLDAVDAVCDQRGDKGVDGIYVNEDAGIVEIYQSKISQKKKSSIGDTMLKEFAGTLQQFSSVKTLESLVATAGEVQLVNLIRRLDLIQRLPEFEIKGVFISNIELDSNGRAYLNSNPQIKFVGPGKMNETFVPSARQSPVSKTVALDISGFEYAEYIVDANRVAVIAPVKALELAALPGISNQLLFRYNVRGPLGRTQVNRDITASIKKTEIHKLFPLFHNGITVVADEVSANKEKITLKNCFVVNGCQSLSALYANREFLTNDLRILTKIVKTSPDSDFAEMVTRFSNNQNGVKARDFKSNNPIQIRLQNEIRTAYKGKYFYEIKRGEDSGGAEVITNEVAGLYLMAFDLKMPWGTHRKYQVFDDLHADLFARPGVNAHRIVFLHLMADRIDDAIGGIDNSLIARYALTRYLLFYILRIIFENDPLGKLVVGTPETVMLSAAKKTAFLTAVDAVFSEVITDLNAEFRSLAEDFDYRGKLRETEWVEKIVSEIVTTHQKLVARGRSDSLEAIYTEALGKKSA